MPYWTRLLIVVLVVSGALLWLLGVDWRTGVDILIIVAGVTPQVIRRSPALYLRYQRARYFATNAETTWEVGLRFSGDFSPVSLDAFVAELARSRPAETQVLEHTEVRYLVRYQRVFTVEFLLGDDFGGMRSTGSSYSSLTVTVFDQVVSYRRTAKMLEGSVLPLIERVRQTFKPDKSTYSLRVRFEGPNPFFGMYVQELRKDLVDDFQFEFHLPASQPNEYV